MENENDIIIDYDCHPETDEVIIWNFDNQQEIISTMMLELLQYKRRTA